MNKYITLLALAAVASTGLAQQKFQPKHPGIIARQIEQKQNQQEVDIKQLIGDRINKPVKTAALVDEDELQIDSVTVTQLDRVKMVAYYTYYSNGNPANMVAFDLDEFDNKVEVEHEEWSEFYPEKDSYKIVYGFNEYSEEYGATTKTVITGDNTDSYCVYSRKGNEWKPSYRVSTIKYDYRDQSVAYYDYDDQYNEYLVDSIAYTYDVEDRLVREAYYVVEDGQVVELGYFTTSYDECMTPAGPGFSTTVQSSDNAYKNVSIYSDESDYMYDAVYEKDGNDEWEIHKEKTTNFYPDSIVTVVLTYEDNEVMYGKKDVAVITLDEDVQSYKSWKYESADATQWTLLSYTEDVLFDTPTEFGRDNSYHYNFVYTPNEAGELTDDYIMSYEELFWTGSYTCCEREYYDGKEDISELVTIYYHDPSATAISDIKAALPNDGQQFDLFGRRLSNGQRGAFMIKNGQVQRVTE